MKSAGFHEMSFCVMIKYRSFDFRKTKNDYSKLKITEPIFVTLGSRKLLP